MTAGSPKSAASDVWLLLAIAYASGDGPGAESWAIRFVAEFLGRPLGPEESWRGDLDRLAAAGLVREHGGRVRPTEAVQAFFRPRVHRRGVRHDFEDLLRFLGARPPTCTKSAGRPS
jgi:hypothetical protein